MEKIFAADDETGEIVAEAIVNKDMPDVFYAEVQESDKRLIAASRISFQGSTACYPQSHIDELNAKHEEQLKYQTVVAYDCAVRATEDVLNAKHEAELKAQRPKDNEIAEFVNGLTSIAIAYGQAQMLRGKVSEYVNKFLNAKAKDDERPTDAANNNAEET